MSDLKLAPDNRENRETFVSWFRQRGLLEPILGRHVLMISDDKGLIGGVVLYVTDGPWMFVEHGTVRPNESLAMIERVIKFWIQAARDIGIFFCKVPIVHVQDNYLGKILLKNGFVPSNVQVFHYSMSAAASNDAMKPDPVEEPEPKKKKAVSICIQCGESFLSEEHKEMCDGCEEEERFKGKSPEKKEIEGSHAEEGSEGERPPTKKRVSSRRKKTGKGGKDVHSSD